MIPPYQQRLSFPLMLLQLQQHLLLLTLLLILLLLPRSLRLPLPRLQGAFSMYPLMPPEKQRNRRVEEWIEK
jgi:hypothetical protein